MPADAIQTGFWIDHSRGAILGATLTYNSRWGVLLITAASVLVQITGAATWSLLSFFLHQHLVPRSPHDEPDAQRSVILRNSSATSAVLGFYSLGSAWRKRAPHAWLRALSMMMLPLTVIGLCRR